MKKIYFLFLLLMGMTIVHAQQWQVYNANELPTASTPAWSPSCTSPGPDNVDSIISLSSNNLFYYLSPDVAGQNSYKIDYPDTLGMQMTLVIRMKGIPNVDTLDRLFDLELRNGNALVRDKLLIGYDDTLGFETAGGRAYVGSSVKDWHIYRFTIDSASVAVYVDENNTPLLTGVTNKSTTDIQVKVGDCSGSYSNGAIIDWIAWLPDTAASPADVALPTDLNIQTGAPSATGHFGTVYYIVREQASNYDGSGNLLDQPLIDSLKKAGYDVKFTYPTTPSDPSFYRMLNTADLVIIGRNVSSGDFQEPDLWASVTSPVLILSGYIIRNSRLNLLNSGSLVREAIQADSSNMSRITQAKVADPSDVAFKGVTINGADSTMDYMTWFYDYIAYGADTFSTTNNGKLLASIINADTARAEGNVLAARWKPGVETYPGSGIVPMGYRTYIQMGADDNHSPKYYNYNQYTAESYKLILNEADNLIRHGENITFLTRSDNADSTGRLLDQALVDSLTDIGYNLNITYLTSSTQVLTPFNSSDLVIIGRNVRSADFTNPEGWNALDVPILDLSAYIVRGSRLGLVSSEKVNREIDIADSSNMNRITQAKVWDPSDPAFDGVAVNGADSTMNYMTWFYDYLGYGVDTFATTNNGKALASIINADTARANGNLLAARWQPFVETWPGSGYVPNGYRSYIQMGADDKSTPKVFNYAQYTSDSYQLILNEIHLLLSTQPGKAPAAAPSTDATLDSLTVSSGALDPAFDSAVTSYTVWLAPGTTTVPTVHYVTGDANASVQVVDATGLPGTTIVRVTAEDGVTIVNYLINFKVLSNDATLKSLSVSTGTLNPAFSASTTSYTVELPSGTTTAPTVSATANDAQATVKITDATSLPGSATVLVTAQDSTTTMTYTVTYSVVSGINGPMNDILSVYPNPASNLLHVELAAGTGQLEISIYNVLGKKVLTQTVTRKSATIDISGLHKGLYLIRSSQDNAELYLKFIKK